MKAAIRSKYGKPEVLNIETVPTPTPGDVEILIRVKAFTVNRTDCANVSGSPLIIRLFTGLFKPKSPVPGTDFAGVVEAVGKGVSRFKPGDRVWGFDDLGLASQAEYLCIAETKAIETIPEGISFSQAAASAEGAHYAINFINKVDIQPTHKVLVNGASGAIGSAMVQLLKARGVYVTAVSSPESLSQIQATGVDKLMDYTKTDFTQDPERYHFVFDAVGKSTFTRCKHLLLPGGVYCSSELGPGWQNPFLALITPWFGGKKVIFPIPSRIDESLKLVRALLEKGQFKPLIDRVYPLEQIREAYAYTASGQKQGNLVVEL